MVDSLPLPDMVLLGELVERHMLSGGGDADMVLLGELVERHMLSGGGDADPLPLPKPWIGGVV